MKLPFTQDQFLDTFAVYNTAIWPLPVIAYVLAVGVVLLALKRTSVSGRLIGCVLAFLWLFTGAGYHIAHFARINRAALVFGAAFLLQGALLLWHLVASPRVSFQARLTVRGAVGAGMVLYAMVLYPLLGRLWGHGYPRGPSFGLTPCPLTIFTFGLLLWARERVPRPLLVIPVLWSLIGFGAALSLGMTEDLVLALSAALAVVLLLRPDGQPGTDSA